MRTELAPICLGSLRALGAILLLSCATSACAAGTPRVASDLEAEVPPELRADYLSFATNCNKCHDLERPLNAYISDVHHWDLYVAKMMRTAGSSISAAEAPKILRFLYWYTERKQRLANQASEKVALPASSAAAEPTAPQGATPAPVPTPSTTETSAKDQGPVGGNEGDGAP
jgi:hypothetical protein